MKKSTCLYALALMASIGLYGVQAAWADRDDRGDRHWHDGREGWHEHAREAHEWHHQHWHDGRVVYEENQPYVTYAPPVVVPPPDYSDEQPSVNFVIPLNIH